MRVGFPELGGILQSLGPRHSSKRAVDVPSSLVPSQVRKPWFLLATRLRVPLALECLLLVSQMSKSGEIHAGRLERQSSHPHRQRSNGLESKASHHFFQAFWSEKSNPWAHFKVPFTFAQRLCYGQGKDCRPTSDRGEILYHERPVDILI